MLYQHEQKECVSRIRWRRKKKNLYLCCCPAPWPCAVRPQSSDFDVTSIFVLLECVLCSFLLLIRAVSRQCAAKNAQTSPWGACSSPWSLGLFKAPWVSFPFVCVQCCAFDLCCAQLFSLLSYGASHTLKKPRGTHLRYNIEMRSLAWFLLLVFQCEASQTSPLLTR